MVAVAIVLSTRLTLRQHRSIILPAFECSSIFAKHIKPTYCSLCLLDDRYIFNQSWTTIELALTGSDGFNVKINQKVMGILV